jgi:hypothetical protein
VSGYRLAPGVAWVLVEPASHALAQAEPRAVVARVPDGPPVALHGSSAVIWTYAVDGGATEDVISRVVEVTGEDRDRVAAQVAAFLDDLVHRELLSRD